MMGLGMGELLVILLIVVLMFGGKKLPQLGASIGESIKNFKKGMKEDDTDKKSQLLDSFILKTSVLTLVVIILSACAATSRNTKHIGLYQYVTRDSHIVNSFKAGDFQEARKIITLETNYLRLFFEQTYEPIFGAPKWNKECLKANRIAGARIEGDEIYAIPIAI